MARYKLLQTVDVTLVAPVVDPVGPKADVAIAFAGHDADGKFTFDLPAYDTTKFSVLHALHVSLFAKPPGTIGVAAIPADPAAIVASPLSYSTGCASVTGGGKVVVDATAAPEGAYTAALVAEFDA